MSFRTGISGGGYISVRLAVKAITNKEDSHREDDFLERLADELMLEEVLAGEASPVEFLRDSLNKVINDMEIQRQEVNLDRLKRGLV